MSKNWKTVSRSALIFGCLAIVAAMAPLSEAQTVKLTNGEGDVIEVKVGNDDKDNRVPVDVAILLDTSNSMDGLINQARNQLWQIVQRLSETEKDGRKPALRVSVFEYGNSNLPATENYIRQVIPLSDDLDKVSEALFALKTDGGDEYCGAVIGEAIKRLDWSKDNDAYKSIFIAGNEAFTQGQVSYLSTCADAKEKSIVVNTIHCGDHSTGVKGMWSDGASKGGGQSFNINQDRKQVSIPCPQDKILIELNTKLNKTYLWFGNDSERALYCENQVAQDRNAFKGSIAGKMEALSGSAAPAFSSRALSKASGLYDNRKRDLVDAEEADELDLASLGEDMLPEEMRKMDTEQRKKFVAEKKTERQQIQDEIKKVAKERETYLKAELAKRGGVKDTLGDVICESIDQQLTERGFEATR